MERLQYKTISPALPKCKSWDNLDIYCERLLSAYWVPTLYRKLKIALKDRSQMLPMKIITVYHLVKLENNIIHRNPVLTGNHADCGEMSAPHQAAFLISVAEH
jgi:hypothetical protein